MTCTSHCCGAETIFDEKKAEKSLKKYLKKGPEKFTKLLLNALYKNELTNFSLLDIGGGIGILQHELIKKGIIKTTDVDASTAYIATAKQLMKKNDTENKMKFIYADFNDCHQEIEKHDIVTLSRVVCCYPDAVGLINNSIAKTNKFYGLIYPRTGFLAQIFQKIMNLGMYLKKNPFRVFMHSEELINKTVCNNGFERIYYGNAFPWRVVLYQRINQTES